LESGDVGGGAEVFQMGGRYGGDNGHVRLHQLAGLVHSARGHLLHPELRGSVHGGQIPGDTIGRVGGGAAAVALVATGECELGHGHGGRFADTAGDGDDDTIEFTTGG